MPSALDGYKILDDAGRGHVLFCYLDESGDLNFSSNGSRYYLYTAMATRHPLPLMDDMLRGKYSIVLSGENLSHSHATNDYFHATEDSLETREVAFSVLERHVNEYRIYSCTADKLSLPDSMHDQAAFYSRIAKELVEMVLRDEYSRKPYSHVCVLIDRIPVHKKSNTVRAAIKHAMKSITSEVGATFSFRPMESQSDFGLQAADYCSWAHYQERTKNANEYVGRLAASIALIKELDFNRGENKD